MMLALVLAAITWSSAPREEYGSWPADSCYGGTIGAAAYARRAVLVLAPSSADPRGATLHILARSVVTFHAGDIRRVGDSLQLNMRQPSDTGRTILTGATDERGSFSGTWRRGTTTLLFVFAPMLRESAVRDLVGRWEGEVAIAVGRVNQLALKIALAPCGDVLATIEAQDRTSPDLAITSLITSGDSLGFEMAYLNLQYRGVVSSDRTSIQGVLTQDGIEYPVTFARKTSSLGLLGRTGSQRHNGRP